MQEKQHFGVIGAGVVGAGIAWHLAKRGHRVALIEQGPVPNPIGASFDQHRLTRGIYAEQPLRQSRYGRACGYDRLSNERSQA